MGYNKNNRSRPPASELARATGAEVLGTGAKVLRSRFERERQARSAEKRLRDMRVIADRCARLLVPGPPAIEHGEVLYDDRGLPG